MGSGRVTKITLRNWFCVEVRPWAWVCGAVAVDVYVRVRIPMSAMTATAIDRQAPVAVLLIDRCGRACTLDWLFGGILAASVLMGVLTWP
jgi:hypothetical protein